MLTFIKWLLLFLRGKPKLIIEQKEMTSLSREVKFKMFVNKHLGLGILFILLEEIGKGESLRNNQGPDITRYKAGHGMLGPWCAALICYGAEQTLKLLESAVVLCRNHGARKLFYVIFGEHMGGELTNIPAPGHLVLFSRGKIGDWKAHIGVVSRVLIDKETGEVLKWWYIAGNEGFFPAKVKERRGDKKKRLEGFMDLSKIAV
jgi:hypothetical protein